MGSGTMRTGPPTDGVSKGSLPQLPWQLWGCGVLPRAPTPQLLPPSSVVQRDPQLRPVPPTKPLGLQGDEAGPKKLSTHCIRMPLVIVASSAPGAEQE